MEFNVWAAKFMSVLREVYRRENLLLVFNSVNPRIGLASNDPKLLCKGNNKNFFKDDLEKIINENWATSPYKDWTRTDMFISDNILYLAIYDVNAIHFCDLDCVILAFGHSEKYLVQESVCEIAKNQYVRPPSFFDVNVCNRDMSIKMILEFHVDFSVEKLMISYSFDWNLKFMKLSENAKAPTPATKGSVGYGVYSAVYRSISPSECELVATDITLIPPPGVYPRVAPRSRLALKNTNVGADVIDIDCRGNLQVLTINHSTKEHLHTEPGDKFAQFILTKFDAPEIVEVFSLDGTERGDKGFGSSGK